MRCAKCKQAKDPSEFRPKGKSYPGALHSYCRPCDILYKAAYYEKNAEKIRAATLARARANPAAKKARDREYREKNRERCSEVSKAWAARNPDRRRAIWKKYYAANREKADARTKKWIKDHPHHVSERSRRLKAHRKQCYVAWADRDAMAAIYKESDRLTRETGIRHEVDHIVPLTSKIVCGLHWEGNLQVLPMNENRAKNNKLLVDS